MATVTAPSLTCRQTPDATLPAACTDTTTRDRAAVKRHYKDSAQFRPHPSLTEQVSSAVHSGESVVSRVFQAGEAKLSAGIQSLKDTFNFVTSLVSSEIWANMYMFQRNDEARQDELRQEERDKAKEAARVAERQRDDKASFERTQSKLQTQASQAV